MDPAMGGQLELTGVEQAGALGAQILASSSLEVT
jgi:hypothetical protein